MSESELLPHKRCWEAFEAALRAARLVGAPDVEVTLWASASALTRFAANRIHQNGLNTGAHRAAHGPCDDEPA